MDNQNIVVKRGQLTFIKETDKAWCFRHGKAFMSFPKSVVKALSYKDIQNQHGVSKRTYAVYVEPWFFKKEGIFYNFRMLHNLEDVKKYDNYIESIETAEK